MLLSSVSRPFGSAPFEFSFEERVVGFEGCDATLESLEAEKRSSRSRSGRSEVGFEFRIRSLQARVKGPEGCQGFYNRIERSTRLLSTERRLPPLSSPRVEREKLTLYACTFSLFLL